MELVVVFVVVVVEGRWSKASRPDVPVGQSLDQEDHVLLLLPILGILSLPGVCCVVSNLLLGLREVGISLLLISTTFAWCKNCSSFHGCQSGGLSRNGSPNDCQCLFLSNGQSPTMCQEVSSSSVLRWWTHVYWVYCAQWWSGYLFPNNFWRVPEVSLMLFCRYKVGNQIFDCLWPSRYHHLWRHSLLISWFISNFA